MRPGCSASKEKCWALSVGLFTNFCVCIKVSKDIFVASSCLIFATSQFLLTLQALASSTRTNQGAGIARCIKVMCMFIPINKTDSLTFLVYVSIRLTSRPQMCDLRTTTLWPVAETIFVTNIFLKLRHLIKINFSISFCYFLIPCSNRIDTRSD